MRSSQPMHITSTFLPKTLPCILLTNIFILYLNIIRFLLLTGYVTSWERMRFSSLFLTRQRLWFRRARLAQSCLRNRCDNEIMSSRDPRWWSPNRLVTHGRWIPCAGQTVEGACQKHTADQTPAGLWCAPGWLPRWPPIYRFALSAFKELHPEVKHCNNKVPRFNGHFFVFVWQKQKT